MNYTRVYNMRFGDVYPLLVAKAEKKNRTAAEVMQVTTWLTGYTEAEILQAIAQGTNYEDFFNHAPAMNPNRKLITGKVCGVQVDTIEDPIYQAVRYLDKLVDELAKGKAMERILRK